MEKDMNGERIRLETKFEIEEEISRVNKSRLRHANNTPLRVYPIQALLGNSEFNCSMGYDKYVRDYLEPILKWNLDLISS